MSEPAEKNDETKPSPQDGLRREYAYKRPWYTISLGGLATFFIFYSGIGNIVGACVMDAWPIPFLARIGCVLFGSVFILLGWYCMRDTIRLICDRKKGIRIVLTGTTFSSPQGPMRSKHFTAELSEIRWIRLIDWYGKKTLKIRVGRRRIVIPETVLASRDLIERLAGDLTETSGVAVERREYRRDQFSLRTILIVITAVAVTLGMTDYFIPDSSGTRLLALWGMMLVVWSPVLVFGWAFAFGRRPFRRVFAVGYAVGMAVEIAGQSHYFSQNMAQQQWPPSGWYPLVLPLLRFFKPQITPTNFSKSLEIGIQCNFGAWIISGLLFGLTALLLWWVVGRWRRRCITGTLDHRAEMMSDKQHP